MSMILFTVCFLFWFWFKCCIQDLQLEMIEFTECQYSFAEKNQQQQKQETEK